LRHVMSLLSETSVPVEIIDPGLVQIVGRERLLGRHEIVRARLARRPKRLHRRRVILEHVARRARRDDIAPGRRTSEALRNHVIEREIGARVSLTAILAAKAVAQEHVTDCARPCRTPRPRSASSRPPP